MNPTLGSSTEHKLVQKSRKLDVEKEMTKMVPGLKAVQCYKTLQSFNQYLVR